MNVIRQQGFRSPCMNKEMSELQVAFSTMPTRLQAKAQCVFCVHNCLKYDQRSFEARANTDVRDVCIQTYAYVPCTVRTCIHGTKNTRTFANNSKVSVTDHSDQAMRGESCAEPTE